MSPLPNALNAQLLGQKPLKDKKASMVPGNWQKEVIEVIDNINR